MLFSKKSSIPYDRIRYIFCHQFHTIYVKTWWKRNVYSNNFYDEKLFLRDDVFPIPRTRTNKPEAVDIWGNQTGRSSLSKVEDIYLEKKHINQISGLRMEVRVVYNFWCNKIYIFSLLMWWLTRTLVVTNTMTDLFSSQLIYIVPLSFRTFHYPRLPL